MLRFRWAAPVLVSLASLGFLSVGCASDSEDDVGEDEAAVLDRGEPRGRAQIHFPSPTAGAPDELCVLPKHVPGGSYDADDEETEQELCSYSFYGTRPREASAPMREVAICPKLTSTNPGVDVEDLLTVTEADGSQHTLTRQETEDRVCSLPDRPTKKLAKYKQSITCSYAPSAIGYYHLSRALGGVGDVKPNVVRTMDLVEHKSIVAEALRILSAKPDSSYPKISWITYRSSESNPAASKYKDAVYTQDLLQIYGGLADNVRGEEKYAELNKKGPDPNTHSLFVQTPEYKRVTDGRPLAQIVGRALADAAQPVVQMRDITEMLLMDYLMSQQDRFGNIHDIPYYYYENADGTFSTVKKSKVDDGEATVPPTAVIVKKMILKDNDCGGPSKRNVVKNAGLLDQIRHMNADTYRHLRWLAANFGRDAEIPKLMVSEALFVPRDIDMLRTNLTTAAQKLHDACAQGRLLLDLDLARHLAGGGHDPAACESSAPPR